MPPAAEHVLTELARHTGELRALGVRRIGLFGSTARGEAGPGSDLDFVVEFDEFSFNRYGGVVELLEQLFRCPVDVAPFDDLRPAYRPYILPEIRYAALD